MHTMHGVAAKVTYHRAHRMAVGQEVEGDRSPSFSPLVKVLLDESAPSLSPLVKGQGDL